MKENNEPRPTLPFGVDIDWRIDGSFMAHYPRPSQSGGAALPTVMTPKEVAAYLRLDVKTVRSMLQRGELPGKCIARRWRIRRSDIDAMFGDVLPPAPLPDSVPAGRRPGRPRKVRRRSSYSAVGWQAA